MSSSTITFGVNLATKLSAFLYKSEDCAPRPDIIKGVRASSIKILSISSTIA